ncbi:hypothetical protein PAAG_03127 [Paecilomyces variotii No. 5]|uniref:Uncharacterized protein n=1 Tax=Byssochlamys spectabilis (strain No. 5 / NBRC 109023) TaxID=1356009 RepID=V5G716_BYSSN|nr:hypothetical protein PAAG_03127 [Paecilomyces variotii No. 5]
MDGQMAEGNSTFHLNCPSTQPEDPGVYCSSGISGVHSPSDQHVNDLGLTLSPGLQQLQDSEFQHDPFLEDVLDELSNDPSLWEDANFPGPSDHGCQMSFDQRENQVSHKRSIDEAFDGENDVSIPCQKKHVAASPVQPNIDLEEALSQVNYEAAERPEPAAISDAGREATPDSLFDEPTSFPPSTDGGSGDKQCESAANEMEIAETPPVSEDTKRRFCLRTDDLEAAKTRELFQSFGQPPSYLSPYPRYGGPLGYLPSTPNVHLRCIQVTSEKVHDQMLNYRRKIQGLTNDRNRYLNLWETWNTLDPATGKSREQLIKEENRQIKREFERQASQIAELREESERWRACYSSLSTTYNQLLYDIYMRNQAGARDNLPTVAPPPQDLQLQQSSLPTPGPQMAEKQGEQQGGAIGVDFRAPPSPSITPVSMPTPVTIDLTFDESDAGCQSRNTSPHSQQGGETGGQLRQSFQKKTYNWLGDRNHMRGRFQAPSGYTADWNPVNRRSSSGSQPNSVTAASYSRSSTADPASVQQVDEEAGLDDDELARLLEQELAGQ